VSKGPQAKPPSGPTPRRMARRILAAAFIAAVAGVLAACQAGLPYGGPAGPATTTPVARPIGGVDTCRRGPRFQSALGLGRGAALATTLTQVKGMAIIDPSGNNGRGLIYQHPSWSGAGFLGPFTTDREGNIYAGPVPVVSLVDNPPEKANRIYRIDTNTQEMTQFAELPAALPPSGASPFGVVGLAYDCETESLYVTSLAGSTATQEVGRIFRVDLKTGQVKDQLDGVDAMGLAPFHGSLGKRLYYGRARTAEVDSIGLDEAGDFVGEPRFEFSFADRAVSDRNTVRRIRIGTNNEMTLNVMDFSFSLKAESRHQEDAFPYRYDPGSDAWTAAGAPITQ
jgi:hypothetical protein